MSAVFAPFWHAAGTAPGQCPASSAAAWWVERASLWQCQDVQEQVTPGARLVKPDAEDIRLVQRYVDARASLVAPLHEPIMRQLPART